MKIWLAIKAISEAVTFSNYRLMWKYLDHKALGMQTVFDKTLKVWINSFAFFSFTSWFCFIKFTETYHETIAIVIAKVHYFTLIWIYLWALVVFLTRYIIIFHNDVLENVEDSRYARVNCKILILFRKCFSQELQFAISFLDCQINHRNSLFDCYIDREFKIRNCLLILNKF